MTHSPAREPRQTMFDKLGWFTVQQLIKYHTLLTVYRIRNSQEPECFAAVFSRDNYFTGNLLHTEEPELELCPPEVERAGQY